jgi:hypothetical protein
MKTQWAFDTTWLIILMCLSTGAARADEMDDMFKDPMLRRCVYWLLTGTRGALIEPLCIQEYQIPSPSLFLCAQKTLTGFQSQTELQACGTIFDEQAKKARSGYVRHKSPPGM